LKLSSPWLNVSSKRPPARWLLTRVKVVMRAVEQG
jgi:hypothetical protein